MPDRIQKIIAQAGLASRRQAETWIQQGRVAVNGETVTQLGAKAEAARDRITVDGQPLRPRLGPQYWLFHKPRGVVSTLRDPQMRPHLAQFLPSRRRLFPAGRLDFHSEGLMLLTDDGEIADRIMRAGEKFPKTYWVKVSGRPGEAQLERLRRGIPLDGRRTAPARIEWLRETLPGPRVSFENPWLEVILTEGRNNQIRRMFLAVGHPVEKLRRVRIGFLRLTGLAPGQARELTAEEQQRLYRELESPARPRRERASPPLAEKAVRPQTTAPRPPLRRPGAPPRPRSAARPGAMRPQTTGPRPPLRRPGAPPASSFERRPQPSARPGSARRPAERGPRPPARRSPPRRSPPRRRET